jgi:RNA polymerase sigma factor (sigma-70 family)
MPSSQANPVLRYIRKLAAANATVNLTDRELLERFTSQHDEAAFGALVHRHGPIVLGLCRRILQNEQDAEDAFQATFLALGRRAGSLRPQETLWGWLYTVAYRISQKARIDAARRRKHEGRTEGGRVADPLAEISLREAHEILDHELVRLPDRFRIPLVLCYLEGLTRDEAAKQLGWAPGTLKSRLEQARERLRRRLASRGLALCGALVASLFCEVAATAAVPAVLLQSTVKAATTVAAGGAAASVSAKVAALTQGGLRAMFLTNVKIATLGLLIAVLLMGGVLIPGLGALTEPSQQTTVTPQEKSQDKEPDKGSAERQNAMKVAKPGGDIVHSLAYCNDGKSVALVLWKKDRGPGSVLLWDVLNGKATHTLEKFDKNAPGRFFNVSASKDGAVIAVSTDKHGKVEYGAIKIWETKTGKFVRAFELDGQVRGVALSADGKKLIGGAALPADGKMYVWDVKTGDVLLTLEAEDMRYHSAAISDDGKRIAGAGFWGRNKGKVVVWDAETGRVRHEWTDENNAMSLVTFSSDGKQVAAAPSRKVIRVWDMETGKLKHELKREIDSALMSIAFSPDGKTLATTALQDAVVSLWELATGKVRATLETEAGGVFCVAFRPDGRALAAGGDDGSVRFWRLAHEKK